MGIFEMVLCKAVIARRCVNIIVVDKEIKGDFGMQAAVVRIVQSACPVSVRLLYPSSQHTELWITPIKLSIPCNKRSVQVLIALPLITCTPHSVFGQQL